MVIKHPTPELRGHQVRKPGSFPSEDHFVVRRENSAVSQIVHSCIQAEKDINIVRLPSEVFDLLCPSRLRNVLELCLDSIGYVAPGKADHRVLVDHKLVHLENCVLDPLLGALSDLFDIGSRSSRRRANAIEEQLLEMIEEREILLRTHFHHDAVGVRRISHPAFSFPPVFLRSTDVTVAKRDQSRRAEGWQLA